MPRIYDNISEYLMSALLATIDTSERADFCVGYFNLRGWKHLDRFVDEWSGEDNSCCRLLVGMQRLPREELHLLYDVHKAPETAEIDNQTAKRLKTQLANEFREQITVGIPTDADEAGLRRLAKQIRAHKVRVKLHLNYPLHAKLYLLFRQDYNNPVTGFMGSSNLTLSGLSEQGELNIDVTDYDACQKLANWFSDRWNDRWSIDISDELAKIIEESWAGEQGIIPYHIYLKMAYHLSQEARSGLSEYTIPRDFSTKLFDYQMAAVKIAAHHLQKRHGVVIADVVGLGKTLTACALARIFQDDFGLETLIICPKNLVSMWEDHLQKYRIIGTVLSSSKAAKELPDLRRYRIVVIDESHHLRNRQTKVYKAVFDYIDKNDSKCILLTATPYNKQYQDLSSQLRLFLSDDQDLGIRPERLIQEIGGEITYQMHHQGGVRSITAFENSSYPEDWQELMRLFMVRRTRSFIVKNYAQRDPQNGRAYLLMDNGNRNYFPVRVPKSVKFAVNPNDPHDQYAQLYSDWVVEQVSNLTLGRYGLGNYVKNPLPRKLSKDEQKIVDDLGRAGKRLIGFCKTNLFKRLESSGHTFLLSLHRHILRNFVFIYALSNGNALPIGSLDVEMFDTSTVDDDTQITTSFGEEHIQNDQIESVYDYSNCTMEWYLNKAAKLYKHYSTTYKSRFKWVNADLFSPDLASDLKNDADTLHKILNMCSRWRADADAKLKQLYELITMKHPKDKILIFTQFSDTVDYLYSNLTQMGAKDIAGVTGDTENPTAVARRFSPKSNDAPLPAGEQIRVMIATDVLSEGQNLQDCSIVVNFDLPWAIIKLIQRAGRVDRIGQESDRITCYSFVPADGVEKIIQLRTRVKQRLSENAQVVGTDELFFEDDITGEQLRDLFTEASGLLDDDDDEEVDLASYAYQIWKNAIDQEPSLEKLIPAIPNVCYSTKPHPASLTKPEGVLLYMRTAEGNDALAWMDQAGESVTMSQYAILRAAECNKATPLLPRIAAHHELVKQGVDFMVKQEHSTGGQLGKPSGARHKLYMLLKNYINRNQNTLLDIPSIRVMLDEVYRCPLKESAKDTINRLFKTGTAEQTIVEIALSLREEAKLCLLQDAPETHEPKLICSMGLVASEGAD